MSQHANHGLAIYRPKHATSDLSITEFLTLARMGFYPHGLVVGVSVVHVGFDVSGMNYTGEVTNITQGMRSARALAVQRMRAQAKSLHAEGVVGVRLEVEHHVWHGQHMVAKFEAIGTAIAFDPSRAPAEFANAPSLLVHGEPFTSDLSGQDFVSLLRAGYRPVTIASGTCMYSVANPGSLMLLGNVELQAHTQAFMNARETAMQQLAADVFTAYPASNDPVHPVGVVGVTVEETMSGKQGTAVVEFSAVGTAVAYLDPSDPRRAAQTPKPHLVVPLDR